MCVCVCVRVGVRVVCDAGVTDLAASPRADKAS